ncbi:unnamed protein product [Phytophthora fragariaefolia]|uniref:Unnamed protein product n=1 Tax=Phytophthora fragariaefolia TaxID=1490495 RepID=A0A9W6XS31_9STRA|nr:unnamed protein product [Phytophthora fragariaefolia]
MDSFGGPNSSGLVATLEVIVHVSSSIKSPSPYHQYLFHGPTSTIPFAKIAAPDFKNDRQIPSKNMRIYSLLVASAAVAVPVSAGSNELSSLPTVKLDYSTIQAIGGNSTVGYYKFQNIRYSKAPIGDLRFAAPQWPDVETGINTGSLADTDVDCASSEDCLFLDVWALLTPWGGTCPCWSTTTVVDFIYVAYIYRLGITGVATGPTYQHEGGVSNLAVWDATHAFEWVHKYISNFGGNPSDVTAVEFSACGSQIGFQMTRFGGNAPQLFQKAFIMSPGYLPSVGHHQAEQFWQNGHFNFSGPCVLTHEQHEYNTVAYTGVESEGDISMTLRVLFPAITDDVIEELLTLYPAENYASAGLRLSDIQQSFEITAKNQVLTRALNNQTWNGEVGIGPAKHGTDQGYYFYSKHKFSASSNQTTSATTFNTAEAALVGAITSPVNETIARKMQKYLLSLVLTGNPNSAWTDDKLYWPRYDNCTMGVQIVMNGTFSVAKDNLATSTSFFWNKALWY